MDRISKTIPQRVWDFYRTAPYGLTLGVIGAAWMVDTLFFSNEVPLSKGVMTGISYLDSIGISTLFEIMQVAKIVISGLLIGASAKSSYNQFLLKNRFEETLETAEIYGNKLFPISSLETWCNRQTAIVAASNYGIEDKIKNYMDNNRDFFRLSYIPNF